jgi:molecular chaperone Hsp33
LSDAAPAHTPDDDLAAAFQIEGWPVRGRLVRMGPAVDAILSAHDYPEPVAALLGEACALAALVGSALKFEGRLIVQAQGNGPVRYVVADYDTAGTLRGYGVFIMTLDQGPDRERHQGVTPIEGETLALCAETYFAQSEQVPTRVNLAVGRVTTDAGQSWRAGGAMIQLIAGDETRGSTEEVWDRTRALFATLGDDELVDPTITPQTLLFRLFHEDGVRLEDPQALAAVCRCSPERVTGMLRSFPEDQRAEMVEDDGKIRVTCEYCSTTYEIEPASV